MNKKLVPVIGILLVLGIGGYMYFQQKSDPQVSPEIKKAQQEIMKNCKYDVDFCKYAVNGMVAMSGGYTMTSESTNDGKKSKMMMRSDGKENSETVTYTDGKEEGKFIYLNKVTYMKNAGDTVWTEFPAVKDEAGKQTANLFDFEGLKEELGNVSKEVEDTMVVKNVGTEKCGTYTCKIFEISESDLGTATKIWVDTKEHRARKMETSTQEEVSSMTFEYGPVTIIKPAPVKQMPAMDSMINTSGKNIDMDKIEEMMEDMPEMSEE
jgi:hypothetical protein